MSSPVRDPASAAGDRALVWAVFCCLLAVYLATFAGEPENPDAEVEFQTASALVRKGSFALGGTPEADFIVSVMTPEGRQGFNVRAGRPGREHEFFSWSGVGQPLVAVPLYVVGSFLARAFPELEARHRESRRMGVGLSELFEHVCVGLRNPLLGALTGALVALAALRTGARRRHALLCGLGYGLCTYAWPQARGTLSDVQATAALFLAFVLAQGALARVAAGRAPRVLGLVGFGLALGLAFLTRPVLAPGVAVLALWFLAGVLRAERAAARPFPLRTLALAFVPALAGFALFLWTNVSRFGNPLEAGYGGVVGKEWFLRAPWQGLAGVTVSPGSGLLWFAPGIVLALPWLVQALRRGERALPLLVLGMVAAIGIPHTLIPSWHGAHCYGPRYLLPLIPFLWLPLGASLGLRSGSLSARIALGALLALGALTATSGALVSYSTNLDLTMQATRIAWPTPPGAASTPEEERVIDDMRFVRAKFDWRFAAPWAHWRILSHRLAGEGESFPARELYHLDSEAVLVPHEEHDQGFRHLAWVDLHQRLGVPAWIGPSLCLALLALAAVLLRRALTSTAP